MEERRLGRSELVIEPVVLGAWAIGGWFWGGTDDEAAIAAIRASLDAGIRGIDTAPVYGFGHSERVVGQAIAGRRDEVVLMTKVGLRWDDDRGAWFFRDQDAQGAELDVYRNGRPDSVRWEVEQSLGRLGVDTIDLVQCHWPDPTTPVEDTMGELARLADEGKVRAIGVSNYGPELLERAESALAAEGRALASDQPPYSLIERGLEADVLPWCRDHQVGVIVYSPMARGLLSGKVGPERVFPPTDGRRDSPLFSIENRRKVMAALDQARELTGALGCTLAQLVVAWCFHQPGVTASIVGARNPAQARENAAAATVELGTEELEWLADLFDAVDLDR